MKQRGPIARWLALLAGIAMFWAFLFVLGPLVVDSSPRFSAFAAYVDQLGFNTGAIYYTDVEIVGNADVGARSSVAYPPHGPK